MLNHSVSSALGFLILSFLTWSITFAFLVFGVILRRKILLWDDQWKEKVEETGVSVSEFAEDLERTYEKMRGTFRLLGFFLAVIVVLMGFVVYLSLQEKPLLGMSQTISSLWLLALVALSVVLPAFVNFALGTYVTETMLLKANAFAYREAKEEVRDKRAKMQMVEKAKQIRSQRDAMRASNNAAKEAARQQEPAAK
ncbi:MAG TPA: hypothetical protein VIJ93_02265 [bacterium]